MGRTCRKYGGPIEVQYYSKNQGGRCMSELGILENLGVGVCPVA